MGVAQEVFPVGRDFRLIVKKSQKIRKCLIALVGLPLAGKSKLGMELAEHSNMKFLDVDYTRHRNFPTLLRLSSQKEKQAMEQSYRINHKQAAYLLAKGQPVVLAATYSRPFYHRLLIKLAEESGAKLRIFYLNIENQEVKKRLKKREKEESCYSNVRSYIAYQAVKNRYTMIKGVDVVILNGKDSVEVNMAKVFDCLKDLPAQTIASRI